MRTMSHTANDQGSWVSSQTFRIHLKLVVWTKHYQTIDIMKQNGSCDITHDCGREKQGAAEYSFFRGARGISIYIYTLHCIEVYAGLLKTPKKLQQAKHRHLQSPPKHHQCWEVYIELHIMRSLINMNSTNRNECWLNVVGNKGIRPTSSIGMRYRSM